MKRNIFVVIFTLLCLKASAQDSIQKAIKVYGDISYSNYGFFYNHKDLNILPVIGYSVISENKNFHEFQFGGFNFASRTNDLYKERNTFFSLRYSYNFALFKSKDWAVRPAIGIGAVPYFESSTRIPLVSTRFRTAKRAVGIGGEIIPRLNWKVSETVFFDVNIPIRIADLGLEYQRVQNPNIPVGQQTNSGVEYDGRILDRFRVQFGLGIKI